MALDRIIRWSPPARAPSTDDLATVARAYTKGLVTSVEWQGGRWYITLPGEAHSAIGRDFLHDPGQARWIEVWRSDGGEEVYVMTRHADEVTNAVAEGLAALVARHWRGEREST